MNYPQPETQKNRPRLLVAPLDWGLGHATRCIPVIYELQKQGAEVWLAAEGKQESLLRQEFPLLPILHLRGYRIKYGRGALGLFSQLLLRAPAILRSIKLEHEWLRKQAEEHHFDAVISDNRFGLFHHSLHTVFITHQLRIKSPLGNWSERLLQGLNYRYINRFRECWVPDLEGDPNLAGQLSHPAKLPRPPLHYIGLLSRLENSPAQTIPGHLFISLSGPEPARSVFEEIVIHQVAKYRGTATIVRGLPGDRKIIPSTNDIRFFNHLPVEEYGREIAKAEFVVSRSGYSTIMDILKMRKKSILVPTPGQPEQEYLARCLMEKKFAFSSTQGEFSLERLLQAASAFEYRLAQFHHEEHFPAFIHSFLQRVSGTRHPAA